MIMNLSYETAVFTARLAHGAAAHPLDDRARRRVGEGSGGGTRRPRNGVLFLEVVMSLFTLGYLL